MPPKKVSVPSPESDFQNIEPPSNAGPSNQDRDSEEPTNNEVPSLAEAITLMTNELKNREPKKSKIKAKEPDTFDGSDPKKLNNFILLCSLYFRSNPAYSDDEAKVTFALSYLRGTALEYFEPTLLADNSPEWLDDWSVFTQTLRTQFGPLDPTADAEDSLDNLKMRDNQRILKYNVDFNRLAIQTGWTDGVLKHRYYSGLAERIKDIMGQQGKPSTLDDMKTLAHAIDARHWERLREKSRAEKSQPKSDNKTPAKSENKSDNKSGNSGKPAKNNNQSSSNTNNNTTSNKSTKSADSGNSVADKLGKDGKLTSGERQRRFDNNLCLYCGGTGHKTSDCKKASASATKAKARAAQVPEKDKDSSEKA
jgi:Retrotransposon gag protein